MELFVTTKVNGEDHRVIIVELDGGIVQDVTGIPKGYVVLVRDYDVEGSNDDRIEKDEHGKEHFASIHTRPDDRKKGE